jgi:heme/copper-type cytochrome/quinol oxidase subunit 2
MGERRNNMITVLIICLIIVGIVLLLSVATTSKAYSYKHTVDSLEDNPNIHKERDQIKEE